MAYENGVQARVMVQFIVEKDGTCTNAKVIHTSALPSKAKNVSAATVENSAEGTNAGMSTEEKEQAKAAALKEMETEALNVVGKMPKWQPASQSGHIVRAQYTIPVIFRLN